MKPSSSPYYDAHAPDYFAATVSADMRSLYAPFLGLLPPAARILDAGCGSGRDSLHFLRQGYHVAAFDASAAMVKLASELTGQQVLLCSFLDIDYQAEFDAVWACASLLHVPRNQIHDALARLVRALKPGGVLYASFKYGSQERIHDERLFNDYDEAAFRELVAAVPALQIIHLWQTGDVRPGRENDKWLNTLSRKTE